MQNVDLYSVGKITENWVATELTFTTDKKYGDCHAFNVILDAIFTHKETGTVLIIPAFWYKENIFKVRFAPTKTGMWEYKTVCIEDNSLDGKTGEVYSVPYCGEYEVYRRGFVKNDGHKYFVYDDGTPFFYLGDTHWRMFGEEIDEAGDRAGDIVCDSHFKYIVDKRAKQGFTVYQSEPINAPFKIAHGIKAEDMDGLIKADRYFKYIADKGLTHANAELFYCGDMTDDVINYEYLEKISRHWVARWGAYPVMWTLAQECDNDFYFEGYKDGGKRLWNHENNPWVKVAEFIHKYDAYSHPLSGHQEGATNTTVTGKGAISKNKSFGGRSVFADKEVTERTGHNWYAAQWKPNFTDMIYNESAEDYWESDKVSVNYEGRYVNLWTDDFGGRCQGWMSYLCGFFGYGYGAQDIWYYKSDYDITEDTVKRDGRSTIKAKDKQIHWSKSLELPSGYHMGYMRSFFEKFDWYNLVPQFDNGKYFVKDDGVCFSCAATANGTVVVYFYNDSDKTGKFVNLDNNTAYEVFTFNPRTNEYKHIAEVSNTDEYQLPLRQDNSDWVAVIKKKYL